jgi:hypothetical protein
MRITKKSMDSYERMKYEVEKELGYPSANVQQAKNAAPQHCQSQLYGKQKKSLSILSHLVKENLSKNVWWMLQV